jgi:hypothetical protein
MARNHCVCNNPVGKRGPRPEVDNLATTPEVFDPLHKRFRFTLDVAALPHNAKLPRFYTPDDDGLEQSWAGERVWCNPPYSSIEPWVQKAWNSGARLVVMLVPANRTEQGWWQRLVEPYRDRAHVCGYCGAAEWPTGGATDPFVTAPRVGPGVCAIEIVTSRRPTARSALPRLGARPRGWEGYA